MNPILEKISKGETRLHDIEAVLAGLEKDAKADDGQITEEDVEWARIQSLRKKIGQVRNSIANLQAEYDTNVKNWNDKEADYKALKAKIEELVTWGDPDAASFRTDVSNIDAAVDDDLYKKATEKLEAAERAIAPYYDEYTAQQPAYTAFQSEEPAFQTLQRRCQNFAIPIRDDYRRIGPDRYDSEHRRRRGRRLELQGRPRSTTDQQ